MGRSFSPDREIGIGIIGTGRHGARYARHIFDGDIPGLRLRGISRRSPEGERQAAGWATEWIADWRKLVASPETDAVIAATTPNLHADIARVCAVHGKPLLIEKPLAASLAEAGEIAALTGRGTIPITVGHTLRFNPIVLGLRDHLALAGRLHSFAACQRLEPTIHPWLDIPAIAGGGVVLHTAVHMFDAMRFITGREVVRVRAVGYRRHNRCLEDLFLAQVEMEDGLVGGIDASKVGSGRCGRYEFVGEDGIVQGDQVHHLLEFVHGTRIEPLAAAAPGPALVPLLRAWLSFLRGEGENPVSAGEGLQAVRIADACMRSMERDDWVALF